MADTVTRNYAAELAARMARLSCDYFEGMFAKERRVELAYEFEEMTATQYQRGRSCRSHVRSRPRLRWRLFDAEDEASPRSEQNGRL